MSRASYTNQARIHNGYHYPRSILTAMRSRISFPRFVRDFSECVVNDFEKYYAIGKILGKVNARQFAEFCRRIGAECEEAPPSVTNMFSPHFIEKVFRVREYAFNSAILCQTMLKRIQTAGVKLSLGTEVRKINLKPGKNGLDAELRIGGQTCSVHANRVFNCTYANSNINGSSILTIFTSIRCTVTI